MMYKTHCQFYFSNKDVINHNIALIFLVSVSPTFNSMPTKKENS